MLEHPAFSDAWAAFGLARPKTGSGWQRANCGGWSCYIEQGRYGHPAKKATWLYAYGVELPSLKWGHVADSEGKALVSWCGNHVSSLHARRARVGKKVASRTPMEFRDVLISTAESASRREAA